MFEAAAAYLLPHPPIIVPAVGREDLRRCRRTNDACREVAARIVARAPARLVLASPHAPQGDRGGSVYVTPRLAGSLGRFGVPSVRVDLPSDAEAVARLRAGADRWIGIDAPLDHGALVPLWFLAEAGWAGPTTVVGLPGRDDRDVLVRAGDALAAALDGLAGPVVLVASGDMSHRVLPGAPAGYDPSAAAFDLACRDAIAQGDFTALAALGDSWRAAAAEDVVAPVTMVAAACGFDGRGAAVVSYEHPFGVGYLVAVLHEAAGGAA